MVTASVSSLRATRLRMAAEAPADGLGVACWSGGPPTWRWLRGLPAPSPGSAATSAFSFCHSVSENAGQGPAGLLVVADNS